MADFTDDFDGASLDGSWTEVDPLGDCTVSVGSGGVTLAVPSGTAHDLVDSTKNAVRIIRDANNSDFYLEAGYIAPLPSTSQQSLGLYIEQDTGNWISFALQFSGGALRAICRSTTSGTSTTEVDSVVGTVVAISLNRTGNSWSLLISDDYVDYTEIDIFTRSLTVSKIGIFAATADGNPAFSGIVDYFVYDEANPVVATGVATSTTPVSGAVTSTANAVQLQPLTGKNILFVVNSAGAPFVGEQAFRTRLQSAGATVTTVVPADAAANIGSKDLFIVSESVSSAAMGSILASSTVPGIIFEAFVWDDHNFISSTAPQLITAQTDITVIMPEHPLSAGLSGQVTVYSASNPMVGASTTLGTIASGATVVARMGATSDVPCLFAFETGATLLSGTAPARRVCSYVVAQLDDVTNAAGESQLNAAVNWAMGLPPTVVGASTTTTPAAGAPTAVAAQVGTATTSTPVAGSTAAGATQQGSATSTTPVAGSATADADTASAEGVATTTTPVAGNAQAAAVQQGTATSVTPTAGATSGVATQQGSATATTPVSGAVTSDPDDVELMDLTSFGILFVVGNSSSLTSGEDALVNRLEAEGAAVTIVTGSDGGAAAAAAVSNKQLFMISESVPESFGATLSASHVPGIVFQPLVWDSNLFCTASFSGAAGGSLGGLLNGETDGQLAML